MPSRRSPSESSFSSASALSTLSNRLSMRTPVCTRSISSMVHCYHGTWIRAGLDHMDSTLDDVALWEGFVGARLPPAEWTHRAHLRMAWMFLRQHPLDAAHLLFRVGIIKLNASHGLTETVTRGYHETLTRVWLGGSAPPAAGPPAGRAPPPPLPPRPPALARAARTRRSAPARLLRQDAR